jgi:hypothetical protein
VTDLLDPGLAASLTTLRRDLSPGTLNLHPPMNLGCGGLCIQQKGPLYWDDDGA